MQFTIYKTPIVSHFLRLVCTLSLKLTGWKLVGKGPTEEKIVIIAAPHTTNWDFPLAVAMAFIFRFDIYWMGKDSLFKGLAGPFMRWLGGIPIDRSKASNNVEATINAFDQNDRLIILITPEGTRSKAERWKTGFYHIAVGANVPIGRGYVDFSQKIAGFGPTFYPTGDIEKDMPEIQAFYKDFKGKYTDKTTEL